MMAESSRGTTYSHWLNWCRLCAKDDVRGNVKVYTNEKGQGTWDNVMIMAIRRYFEVHMRLEDELSSVLCTECYTLISELIDFAEHVTKVQAIFEVLRRTETDQNKKLDVFALRQQYGLCADDWSHIIKPMAVPESVPSPARSLELETEVSVLDLIYHDHVEVFNASGNQDGDTFTLPKPAETIQESQEQILKIAPSDNTPCGISKQEFIDLGPLFQGEKLMENNLDATANALEAEDVLIAEPDAINRLNEQIDSNLEASCGPDECSDEDIKPDVSGNCDDDQEFLQEQPSPATLGIQPPTKNVEKSHTDNYEEKVQSCNPSKRCRMECERCGKSYRNRASYEKHIDQEECQRIVRKVKVDRNTSCDLCHKTLSSVSALRLHKEGMHDNVKPFVCDSCGKQLKTITALNEHKLVHTDSRPFECPVCKAGFKNRARLKVHCQIHEDPSFVCNICGKRLQTRRTWNMHKVVHKEERNLKCDVCGALFKRSKTLKTHLLSHTGLRPYICNYCGKTFACNANCRSHKLKKHSQEIQQGDRESLPSRLSVPTLEELRVITQKLPKDEKQP
ncbi:zinc finger protein weckle-like [Drosophila obscura]|uniref:zinc finger protein weckle-like n=1 Tax=Drosophila obscura TaxID=7282 RepID=UPI001BB1E4FD|nr:zinc finger protein weckle-like [Drosophila obscura]